MRTELQSKLIGDLASECTLRAGDSLLGLPVVGVDSRVGISAQTRYQAEDLSRYKLLKPQAFAYNPMRLNIGSIGFSSKERAPSLVSPDYIVFECKDGLLPEYLSYYTQSQSWKDWVASAGTGSVRSRIYFRELARMPLLVPGIEYQLRAVAVLQQLDEMLDALQSESAALSELETTIFKSWFLDFDPVKAKVSGKAPTGMDIDTAALFPGELTDSVIGRVPKGWAVGTVGDLLQLQRGFDLPAPLRTDGQYKVMAASGPNGTHNQSMVKGPGVTTGRSGVLGRVYFVHEDFWPLNTSLWVKEFRLATPAFAFQLLQSIDLARLNGGSAVPTLNRNEVHAIKTILPDRRIVEAYSALALPLLGRRRSNEMYYEALKATRDTLVARAVTGMLPEMASVAAGERYIRANQGQEGGETLHASGKSSGNG